MLRSSTMAVLARNERWRGKAASEPYECGWAKEAVIFLRLLEPPTGELPDAHVEISPDGMHWAPEGTRIPFPRSIEDTTFARVGHFGGWLRISADLPDGAAATVLSAMHLK